MTLSAEQDKKDWRAHADTVGHPRNCGHWHDDIEDAVECATKMIREAEAEGATAVHLWMESRDPETK